MKQTVRMALDESPAFRLAFDRGSVRTYDHDGRLHVATSPISKANVCPYLGKEIPNAEEMGLDTKKVYQLLRDPQELAKALTSSNNIQLLIKHKPVSTEDPATDLIVGSTGTDAVFRHPYLYNSLVVWDQDAIDGIESDEQKELSSGYHYTADMTPGTYEGVPYDGVMRNIRFNHVALVVDGRAGDDVVVGDSALDVNLLKESHMSKQIKLTRLASMAKGALAVALQPRLAQDAKLDLTPVLEGVGPGNWKESKVKIANAVRSPANRLKFKDKLAQDAGVADVVALLDQLDGEGAKLGDVPPGAPPVQDDPIEGSDVGDPDANLEGESDLGGTGMEAQDSPLEAISALLNGKVDPSIIEQIGQILQSAGGGQDDLAVVDPDGDEIAQKEKELAELQGGNAQAGLPAGKDAETIGKGEPMNLQPKAGGEKLTPPDPNKGTVSQPAMDAAIDKAKKETEASVIKRMRAIAEAEKIVKPYIGDVIAQDSAEAVYKLALDSASIDTAGIHPSAWKAMVLMLPKPGEEKPSVGHMALDSKNVVSFKERFPTAGSVRQLG